MSTNKVGGSGGSAPKPSTPPPKPAASAPKAASASSPSPGAAKSSSGPSSSPSSSSTTSTSSTTPTSSASSTTSSSSSSESKSLDKPKTVTESELKEDLKKEEESKDRFETSDELTKEKEEKPAAERSFSDRLLQHFQKAYGADPKELNQQVNKVGEDLSTGTLTTRQGAEEVQKLESSTSGLSGSSLDKMKDRVQELKEKLAPRREEEQQKAKEEAESDPVGQPKPRRSDEPTDAPIRTEEPNEGTPDPAKILAEGEQPSHSVREAGEQTSRQSKTVDGRVEPRVPRKGDDEPSDQVTRAEDLADPALGRAHRYSSQLDQLLGKGNERDLADPGQVEKSLEARSRFIAGHSNPADAPPEASRTEGVRGVDGTETQARRVRGSEGPRDQDTAAVARGLSREDHAFTSQTKKSKLQEGTDSKRSGSDLPPEVSKSPSDSKVGSTPENESPLQRLERREQEAQELVKNFRETGDSEALEKIGQAFSTAKDNREQTMQTLEQELARAYPPEEARKLAEKALESEDNFFARFSSLYGAGDEATQKDLAELNPAAAELSLREQQKALSEAGLEDQRAGQGVSSLRAVEALKTGAQAAAAGEPQESPATSPLEARASGEPQFAAKLGEASPSDSQTKALVGDTPTKVGQIQDQSKLPSDAEKTEVPRSLTVEPLGLPDAASGEQKPLSSDSTAQESVQATAQEEETEEKSLLERFGGAVQGAVGKVKETVLPSEESPESSAQKIGEVKAEASDAKVEKDPAAEDQVQAHGAEEKSGLPDKAEEAVQETAEEMGRESLVERLGGAFQGAVDKVRETVLPSERASESSVPELETAKAVDPKAEKVPAAEEETKGPEPRGQSGLIEGLKEAFREKLSPAEAQAEADPKLDKVSGPEDSEVDLKGASEAGSFLSTRWMKDLAQKAVDRVSETTVDLLNRFQGLGENEVGLERSILQTGGAAVQKSGEDVAEGASATTGEIRESRGPGRSGERPERGHGVGREERRELRRRLDAQEDAAGERLEQYRENGDTEALERIGQSYELAQENREATIAAFEEELGNAYRGPRHDTRAMAEAALESEDSFYAMYSALHRTGDDAARERLQEVNPVAAEQALREQERSLSDLSALAPEQQVQIVQNAVQSTGREMATNHPEQTRELLERLYPDAEPGKIDELFTQFENGEIPSPENVQFLSEDDEKLRDATSRYDAENGTLYLSEDLQHNPTALIEAMMDGTSRHVDAHMGVDRGTDSIFSLARQGDAGGNDLSESLQREVQRQTNEEVITRTRAFENATSTDERADETRGVLAEEYRALFEREAGDSPLSEEQLQERVSQVVDNALNNAESFDEAYYRLYEAGDEASRERLQELSPGMAALAESRVELSETRQVLTLREAAAENRYSQYRDVEHEGPKLDALSQIQAGFERVQGGGRDDTIDALRQEYRDRGLGAEEALRRAQEAVAGEGALYGQFSSLYRTADEEGRERLRELNPELAGLVDREVNGQLRTDDQWKQDVRETYADTPILGSLLADSAINRVENRLRTSTQSEEQRTLAGAYQEAVRDLATTDPERFAADLRATYPKATEETIANLVDLAREGDFPLAQRVQFVDADNPVLNEQNAAYHAQSQTIYIDRALLDEPDRALSAFVEENGHHLDRLLGGGDSQGDEGQMFERTLLGGGLTLFDKFEARMKNDHSFVVVDGTLMAMQNQARPNAPADPAPGGQPPGLLPVSNVGGIEPPRANQMSHRGPKSSGQGPTNPTAPTVPAPPTNSPPPTVPAPPTNPAPPTVPAPPTNPAPPPPPAPPTTSVQPQNPASAPSVPSQPTVPTAPTNPAPSAPTTPTPVTSPPMPTASPVSARPAPPPPPPPPPPQQQQQPQKPADGSEVKTPEDLQKLSEAVAKLADLPDALNQLEKLQTALKDLGGLSGSLDKLKELSRNLNDLKSLSGNLQSLERLGSMHQQLKDLPQKLTDLDRLPQALNTLSGMSSTLGDLERLPSLLSQMKDLPRQMAELERLPRVLASFGNLPDTLDSLGKLPGLLESARELPKAVTQAKDPRSVAYDRVSSDQSNRPSTNNASTTERGSNLRGALPPGASESAPNNVRIAGPVLGRGYVGRMGEVGQGLGPAIGTDASRQTARPSQTVSARPTAGPSASLGQSNPNSSAPPAAPMNSPERPTNPGQSETRREPAATSLREPTQPSAQREIGSREALRQVPSRLEAASQSPETRQGVQQLQNMVSRPASDGLQKLPQVMQSLEQLPESLKGVERLQSTLGNREQIARGVEGLRGLAESMKAQPERLQGLERLSGLLQAAHDQPDTFRGMRRMPGLINFVEGMKGEGAEPMTRVLQAVRNQPEGLRGLERFTGVLNTLNNNPEAAKGLEHFSRMVASGGFEKLVQTGSRLTSALQSPDAIKGLNRLTGMLTQTRANPQSLAGLERLGAVAQGGDTRGAEGLGRLGSLLDTAQRQPEALRSMVSRVLEAAPQPGRQAQSTLGADLKAGPQIPAADARPAPPKGSQRMSGGRQVVTPAPIGTPSTPGEVRRPGSEAVRQGPESRPLVGGTPARQQPATGAAPVSPSAVPTVSAGAASTVRPGTVAPGSPAAPVARQQPATGAAPAAPSAAPTVSAGAATPTTPTVRPGTVAAATPAAPVAGQQPTIGAAPTVSAGSATPPTPTVRPGAGHSATTAVPASGTPTTSSRPTAQTTSSGAPTFGAVPGSQATPSGTPSSPGRLRDFRQVFGLLQEIHQGRPAAAEHPATLASMSRTPEGAHAVADALEATVVAHPERTLDTFKQLLKTPQSSQAFATTLSNLAETSPERLVGLLLMTSDLPGGTQAVSQMFSTFAADAQSASSLGKVMSASSRTELGATGMKELLNNLMSPDDDGGWTRCSQTAKTLAETSRWNGGARGISETLTNLTNLQGGARDIASMVSRMSRTSEGAQATNELLMNLSADKQGAKDLAKVLTRATKSRAGSRDLATSLTRIAATEAGRDNVSRLMVRLTDSADGARMLGHMAQDRDTAKHLTGLLNRLSESPQASAQMRVALEKALNNPQVRSEMEAFRGRVGTDPGLREVMERITHNPTQSLPLQHSQAARGAEALARLTAFENLVKASSDRPIETPILKVEAASGSSSGGTAGGSQGSGGGSGAENPAPKQPFPYQNHPYPELAVVSEVWRSETGAVKRTGDERLAEQAQGSSNAQSDTSSRNDQEKPGSFRPGDVYSELTLLRARICGDCGFRTNSIGRCARCEYSAVRENMGL